MKNRRWIEVRSQMVVNKVLRIAGEAGEVRDSGHPAIPTATRAGENAPTRDATVRPREQTTVYRGKQ